MRRSRRFHAAMLIISIILGVVSWFVCRAVYGALVDTMARPLLIGLLFGILALAVSAGVFLVSAACGTFERNIVTGGGAGSAAGILAAAVVALMVLAALFQWLYSLRLRTGAAEPTSYVFLIDNSGSMDSSDPLERRYDGIEQVLQTKDAGFPYMVYGFADGVERMREMQPASAGEAALRGSSYGGTSIKLALEQAIADYRKGVWDGGASPKVILLSDGVPTDFESVSDISGVLKEYVKSGISVSTVGLDRVDEALMEEIASRTGGVFVNIQDAALLADAMTSAAALYSEDDLVTTRYNSGRLGILFGLLRILFLTILGVGTGAAAGVAYGQMDSMGMVMGTSVVKSLAGALLLEVCTSLFGLPDWIFWLLLWVLIAAVFCTRLVDFAPRTPASSRSVRPPKRRHGRSSRTVGPV